MLRRRWWAQQQGCCGGGPRGGAAHAAHHTARRSFSACILSCTGTGSAAEGELHHQEEVAEEEAEEWALGQREQHEHEGFEALPWPPPPAGDAPSSRGGSAKHNSGPHNSTNSAGAGPVRCFSGQAGGGGGASGAAGGAASGPGGKMEGDIPPWERAEVLWEAEAPQPGSWRQGGEEDPFQGGAGPEWFPLRLSWAAGMCGQLECATRCDAASFAARTPAAGPANTSSLQCYIYCIYKNWPHKPCRRGGQPAQRGPHEPVCPREDAV